MVLDTKNIVNIIIGIIVAISISILFTYELYTFQSLYIFLILTLILLLAIIWAANANTNEIKDELEIQKLEQKRLSEKLKIHEKLIDIKSDIKNLQKMVHGKKK